MRDSHQKPFTAIDPTFDTNKTESTPDYIQYLLSSEMSFAVISGLIVGIVLVGAFIKNSLSPSASPTQEQPDHHDEKVVTPQQEHSTVVVVHNNNDDETTKIVTTKQQSQQEDSLAVTLVEQAKQVEVEALVSSVEQKEEEHSVIVEEEEEKEEEKEVVVVVSEQLLNEEQTSKTAPVATLFMDEEIAELDIGLEELTLLFQYVEQVNKGEISIELYQQMKLDLLSAISTNAVEEQEQQEVVIEQDDLNHQVEEEEEYDEEEEEEVVVTKQESSIDDVADDLEYDNEYLSSLELSEEQVDQIHELKSYYAENEWSKDVYEKQRDAIIHSAQQVGTNTHIQQEEEEVEQQFVEDQEETTEKKSFGGVSKFAKKLAPTKMLNSAKNIAADLKGDLHTTIVNQKNALKKVQVVEDPWKSVFK